jgi:hypothetical protein
MYNVKISIKELRHTCSVLYTKLMVYCSSVCVVLSHHSLKTPSYLKTILSMVSCRTDSGKDSGQTRCTLGNKAKHLLRSNDSIRGEVQSFSSQRVKVPVLLFVTEHNAMKEYWGSGSTAPRIL